MAWSVKREITITNAEQKYNPTKQLCFKENKTLSELKQQFFLGEKKKNKTNETTRVSFLNDDNRLFSSWR